VTKEYEPISGLSTESSLCRISHRGTSNWKNPFGWAWCPDGIRPKSVEHLCPVRTRRRPTACGGSRRSILCRPPSGNDLHLSGRCVMHLCPLRGPGEASIYEVPITVAARLEPCGPRAVFGSQALLVLEYAVSTVCGKRDRRCWLRRGKQSALREVVIERWSSHLGTQHPSALSAYPDSRRLSHAKS